MLRSAALALLFALSFHATTPPAAHAGQPTEVTVRVLAHDAKLIGSVAGGVAITIRDAATGRILAEGVQRGDTGSTDAIVREPWVRGEQRLDTEGAAGFTTTLDLAAPTLVEVEARGPMGFPTPQHRATRTVRLVPGEDVAGNGIVLTLQGLIVNLIEPSTEATLAAGETIGVEAGVKLLCTCPIEEDGLWDAADYEVRAELWRDGELVVSAPLDFAGRRNVFAGELALPTLEEDEGEVHELRIVAGNAALGNWGTDRATYRLER